MGILRSLLNFGADKDLKRYEKVADAALGYEKKMEGLSDSELLAETDSLRRRLARGEREWDLLPEAFATAREACSRELNMRHFRVQLVGAAALVDGRVAEMATGEGKTIVAQLAAYVMALAGEGVHVVTANEYLAGRDAESCNRVLNRLGMSVSLVKNGMAPAERKQAYAADVTYGTASEFGFDYLRDHMATSARKRVQRGHAAAIVDEADSILIDEARTPLIISGPGGASSETYRLFARAVRGLERGREIDMSVFSEERGQEASGDFVMDEAKRNIAVTEQGLKKIEQRTNLDIYGDLSGALVNHMNQAMKAEYLFHRDREYAVIDGEVKIVDEFTGRIMEGRRYSEGLHQAIEAKEGVEIKDENQTLATVTLQNYFRLYGRMCGMTGTALTEDAEFRETYHMPVQPIPTNKPVARIDHEDRVYRTEGAKYAAVVEEVAARHVSGQPVLVGTTSVESSERLSRLLDKRGIKHNVLNAKNHELEAGIVAEAGVLGAVTVATNMAGRGTDILLGGTPEWRAKKWLDEFPATDEVKAVIASSQLKEERENTRPHDEVAALGGLCVIGTERHESRRIDNQLRGRAGRQGDPGETLFFLSLEDDLMRRFGEGTERVDAWMERIGVGEDEVLESKMVTRAIEGAQRKVEDMNAAVRAQVLEYDDVMDKQRRAIYAARDEILDGRDLCQRTDEIIDSVAARHLDDGPTWLADMLGQDGVCADRPEEALRAAYATKVETYGEEVTGKLARAVMLRVIDARWRDHLRDMDYLKAGIGLRGFAQRDPVTEYKREAHAAYEQLIDVIYEDYLRTLLRAEKQEHSLKTSAPRRQFSRMTVPKEGRRSGERVNVSGAAGHKLNVTVKTTAADGTVTQRTLERDASTLRVTGVKKVGHRTSDAVE